MDSLELPAPSASTVDRIKYLIKLNRKTQAQFGALIGVDASNMSKFLSGKAPLTEGFLNRIVVNLGVSKQWLTTGTDVPFPREAAAPGVITDGQHVGVGKGALVYDIDATAGFGEMSRMFTSDRIIGTLNMPNISPNCVIVHVSGDSMLPRINNGAYIAIRPISPDSPIFWGQVYLVVMDDYRMVKVVRKHPDPDKFILHSYNPDYDDMEVSRSAVRSLYVVDTVLNYEILG